MTRRFEYNPPYTPMNICAKRVYDPPEPSDGYRLCVMRRWPRGIRKQAVDAWERELAPSGLLLDHWRLGRISGEEFAARYQAEVGQKPALLEAVRERARQDTVTLLCGCRDADRCHRTVLRQLLLGSL